jgi:hypothetical protein
MANIFPNPDQTWRKGQSGNPRGRPRGRTFRAARAYLAATVNRNDTVAQLAALRLIEAMLRGDLRAIKMVLEAEAEEEHGR